MALALLQDAPATYQYSGYLLKLCKGSERLFVNKASATELSRHIGKAIRAHLFASSKIVLVQIVEPRVREVETAQTRADR